MCRPNVSLEMMNVDMKATSKSFS